MTYLATAVAAAMAAVLLRAAMEKTRDLKPVSGTIRALGIPRALVRPVAVFMTVAEIAVAIAVLFRPDATLTHAAIVSLAALFALAGLLALRIKEPIRCSCFGAGGGYLGIRQVLFFVPWITGVAILRFGAVTPLSQVSAAWFAAISLAIATTQAVAVRKAQAVARGDRRSAWETYEWLRSH